MATRTDLRIGDADRDACAASLREHYAQGRLSLEDFNERLDAVFAATTRGQLDAITRDLPHVTTPYVPLPVTMASQAGDGGSAGSSGAGYHGRAARSLMVALVALLAVWFLALGPAMLNFRFFPWPGRYLLLLAGLTIFRSVVRRLFGGRRRGSR
jgi:Domain of unknown function (DUF1707)